MADARKSDGADSKKKTIMPRLLVGVWLIALTVLLVILFTNMPEKTDDSPGKPLVKKIILPPPDELKSLVADKADQTSVDQLNNRVDVVETKADRVDGIEKKVAAHDGEIAVLDQRVDRLETTVSDKLSLPSKSFSDIPTPPPTEKPDAEKPDAEKPDAKKSNAGKPDPATAKTPVKKPAGTAAAQSTPQPDEGEVKAPAAEKTPEKEKKRPTPSSGKADLAAAPPPKAPSAGREETAADRRSVQQKIAAREAYIQRSAPLRRSTPSPDGERPPGAGGPAGSLHSLSSRFGHRVDFSDKLNGRDGAAMVKTAPGMTMFPDRSLNIRQID